MNSVQVFAVQSIRKIGKKPLKKNQNNKDNRMISRSAADREVTQAAKKKKKKLPGNGKTGKKGNSILREISISP